MTCGVCVCGRARVQPLGSAAPLESLGVVDGRVQLELLVAADGDDIAAGASCPSLPSPCLDRSSRCMLGEADMFDGRSCMMRCMHGRMNTCEFHRVFVVSHVEMRPHNGQSADSCFLVSRHVNSALDSKHGCKGGFTTPNHVMGVESTTDKQTTALSTPMNVFWR